MVVGVQTQCLQLGGYGKALKTIHEDKMKGDFVVIDEKLYDQSLQTLAFDAIDDIIEADPDHVACYNNVNDISDAVTYSQLKERALAIAAFLESKGFRKGTDAMIILPNVWQFIASWLGTLYQGMSFTGITPKFGKHDTHAAIKRAKAPLVFTNKECLEKVRQINAEEGTITCLIVVDANDNEVREGEYSLEIILRTPIDYDRPFVAVDPKEDVALMHYTSGTTGTAKGVMLTHRNLAATVINTEMNEKLFWNAAFKKPWNWHEEVLVASVPMIHPFGTWQMLYFLKKGVAFMMVNDGDVVSFCRAVSLFKIRLLVLHPGKISDLINFTRNRFDMSSVECILTCGAALSSFTNNQARQSWSHLEHIYQAWGMSECMGPLLVDLRKNKFGSVGRAPPGVEIKVIDDNGNALPSGHVGELCVKSPTVMKEYLDRPEETASTIVDGFLHTGDMGRIDEDGYFFFSGRKKQIIKVDEYSVFPCELEAVLIADPRIRDAAVIGVPVSSNPSDGEVPKAFVVKATENVTEEDVCAIVSERLAVYKKLRGGVVFLPAIPKTPIGKTQYTLLK